MFDPVPKSDDTLEFISKIMQYVQCNKVYEAVASELFLIIFMPEKTHDNIIID